MTSGDLVLHQCQQHLAPAWCVVGVYGMDEKRARAQHVGIGHVPLILTQHTQHFTW